MRDDLLAKARNYYILGLYAQLREMYAEAVANYFKAIFALADGQLFAKTGRTSASHTDRFECLREHDPVLYGLIDGIFLIYRETYTKEITLARVKFVRERTDEIFKHTGTQKPTEKDL
ncbi:hypothetical protein HZB02_01770 [Candidatus Woesearchaeota archaeon]|nr:hypothetical protein [Candidatus Woesearchaeota archaeon]